jgi:DNA-binding response OmpR family regulator
MRQCASGGLTGMDDSMDLKSRTLTDRSGAGAAHFSSACRVLIADDYVDAAESLALLLSSAGVETDVALDGEQALARANSWRPHVCVLDLQMPKVDGREIARRIREQNWGERPLLIALTGWTSARDRCGALEAGFDHYITKPVDPVVLMNLVQDFCAGTPCE